MLLASTTARHAQNAHGDSIPSLTDVRTALQECGALIPVSQAAEEEWEEVLRRPVEEMGRHEGGRAREQAEKRKRDDGDVADVHQFVKYFNSDQYREVKRVAGMLPDANAAGAAAVGVGGGAVHVEDFLTGLMRKYQKGADESRLQGTVLGKVGEDRSVVIEGGPVGKLEDWGGVAMKENAAPVSVEEAEAT